MAYQQPSIHELCEDAVTQEGTRRSQREIKPTERSLQYRNEVVKCKERDFCKVYESFKVKLRGIREAIKKELSEEELYYHKQTLEGEYNRVECVYEDLRSCASEIEDFACYQRKIDTAAACQKDMAIHIHYRMSEVGVKDFDVNDELTKLRTLKKPYAASVYSVATSCQSERSARAVEAAAELAVSQVRCKALEAQEQEKLQLVKLEEAVAAQKRKLELLKAQQEVNEKGVKFRVLHSAVVDDNTGEIVNPHITHQSTSHSQINFSLNPHAEVFAPDAPTYVNMPVGSRDVNESTLATALTNTLDRIRLPVPTPKVFSGNPIEFVNFKRSFKLLIENKGISPEEKIYYLQQYVVGEAREAIAGRLYGISEADYQCAWQTLETRFGHPFRIQEAFRERLDKWPKVGPKDGHAMQAYADVLRSCLDAKQYMRGLGVLDDCKENQKMTSKLPDWAIIHWSRIVSESLDNSAEYPPFERFVSFVEKEARAVCHPVASFSAVKGLGSAGRSGFRTAEGVGSARNLVVDQAELCSACPLTTGLDRPDDRKWCPFCKGEHYFSGCQKFAALSVADRGTFLREGKRCFGCLRVGHFSKQCKARHTCLKCKGRHPTVLHDDKRERILTSQNSLQKEKEETAASLNADRGQSSTTNVVPVWISTVGRPGVERLVYALLDTQSDSTFVDQKICDELSAPAEPVKLKLSTLLGKDVSVDSQRVSGLRIRGYTSAQYITLPVAYTRDFIPLNREHIPICDTARGWNHLASIASEIPPLLECDVGLLIGYNCSVALAPREVVTGEDSQPYAIKTDLGWSIVGSLASTNATDVTGFCHRTSVKEMPPAAFRDILKVLESDFNDSGKDDVSMSQEDVQFLSTLEAGIVKNTQGHFEMPLPFKSRPRLLDNRLLAERRLYFLKKKLNNSTVYKQQYTEFVEGMITNGHAELVTQPAKFGEVHYLPHHGVYHPKKADKLRVVFDCSAKFLGKSLNDFLLSGPDLTSSLFGVLCRFRHKPVAIMCDIQKMFHQFHVAVEDRDYLRFLWWDKGDTSTRAQEYRMNVHLFGAPSSPGCANFALKHLSKTYENLYSQAAKFLQQNFYVDDGITSVDSVSEAEFNKRNARSMLTGMSTPSQVCLK